MKKYLKILSFLVSVSMMITSFASCGDNADDKDSSKTSNSSKESSQASSSIDENSSADDNSKTDKNSDNSSKAENKNNSKNSADSEQDDLSGTVVKTYSVATLKDPNATDEDKAEAFRLIMSKAANDGANASAEVPGGEKIKENLNKNNSNNTSNKNSNSNSNNTSNNNSNNGSNNTKPADKNDDSSKNDSNTQKDPEKPSKPPVKLNGDEKTFVITVYPKIAPETAENFLELVNKGFYDGMEFNRVISNFLAQAGDKDGNGTGTSEKTIKGEFSHNGFNNTLSHTKGVVSMNRKPEDDNSATSQFFICYNDECKFMDGNYAAFGKVTEGMNVVNGFQNIETTTGKDGAKSKPVSPIKIKLADQIDKDSSGNPRVKFYVTY